jgi:hypothetical protein
MMKIATFVKPQNGSEHAIKQFNHRNNNYTMNILTTP